MLLFKKSEIRNNNAFHQKVVKAPKKEHMKNERFFINIFISSGLVGMDQSSCKASKSKKDDAERDAKNNYETVKKNLK